MGKLSVSLPEAEKLISIAEGHLHKAFGEQ